MQNSSSVVRVDLLKIGPAVGLTNQTLKKGCTCGKKATNFLRLRIGRKSVNSKYH